MTDAVRPEENALPIGRPAHYAVRIGMVGDALRNAAGHGNRENVDIAVVLAGEGQRLTVGREDGFGLKSYARGETSGRAAVTGHAPQIARIREGDVGLAHGGSLD